MTTAPSRDEQDRDVEQDQDEDGGVGLTRGHVRDRGAHVVDRVEGVTEDGLPQDPVGVGVSGSQGELGARDADHTPQRDRP
jgi:hypothetical protein